MLNGKPENASFFCISQIVENELNTTGSAASNELRCDRMKRRLNYVSSRCQEKKMHILSDEDIFG